MKAYRQRYLRTRTEISADKDGDICGQKRRYPPAKPHKGLTNKMHIVVTIPSTGNLLIFIVVMSMILKIKNANDYSHYNIRKAFLRKYENAFLYVIRTIETQGLSINAS